MDGCKAENIIHTWSTLGFLPQWLSGFMHSDQTPPSDPLLQVRPSLHDGFMLDDVEVFPHQQSIVRNGQHFTVSRKAIEVLMLLASYPGEVLTREQLCHFVWGKERNDKGKLTHSISELRHALHDDKALPKFIQTLPRRGYRLLQPVSPLSDHLGQWPHHDAQDASHPNPVKRAFAQWRRRRIFKAAVTYTLVAWILMQVVSVTLPILDANGWHDKLILLLLIAFFPFVLLYAWWAEFRVKSMYAKQADTLIDTAEIKRRAFIDLSYIAIVAAFCATFCYYLAQQLSTSDNDIPTPLARVETLPNAIAILPYQQINLLSHEHFAQLLQSELISFLSQYAEVTLPSRRTLSSLPSDASLELIRQRTRASYVLEGSVTRVADQLKIQSTLTNTNTGFTEWSSELVGGSDESLQLLEKLSRQIVNALSFIDPSNQDDGQFKPTEDFQAFNDYLEGQHLLGSAYNLQGFEAAASYFARALSRDPRFVLALAGLCQSQLGAYRISQNVDTFELAQQNCQQLGESEQRRFASEVALGQLYLASGQYTEALDFFRRANQLNPDDSDVIALIAKAYTRTGQLELAEQFFLRAIRLDPGAWQHYESYGEYLFRQGRFKEASVQYSMQVTIVPDNETALNSLGAAFYMSDESEKARIAWERAVEINPSAPTYSNLASLAFYRQDFRKAAELYAQAVQLRPNDHVVLANWADSLKFLPDPDASQHAYSLALAAAQQSLGVNPNDMLTTSALARYQAELSQCDTAKQGQQQLLEKKPSDPYIFYDMALIAIRCKSSADVLMFLNRAIEAGYPPETLQQDPQFSAVRAHLEALLADGRNGFPNQ